MLYKKNKDFMIFEQENKGIAQMPDGTIHILNSTALEVFTICDGKTEKDIVDIIKSNYENVDFEIIHSDVKEILQLMVDKNIIILDED